MRASPPPLPSRRQDPDGRGTAPPRTSHDPFAGATAAAFIWGLPRWIIPSPNRSPRIVPRRPLRVVADRHVPRLQPADGAPPSQHIEQRCLLDRASGFDAGKRRTVPLPFVRLPPPPLVAAERRPHPVPMAPLDGRRLPREMPSTSIIPPDELVERGVIQVKGHGLGRSVERGDWRGEIDAFQGEGITQRQRPRVVRPCAIFFTVQ
jgi:hypothetical protein